MPVTAAPRAIKTIRQLDPEAVKLLMQQGEQFVAAGDLVTARLVFQRAAEAGDATAALAMGATYDPIVLAKLGARGVGADVDKARTWYQKAQEFGSPEAPHRIEMLANR
jgi:TPR repeat protein